MAPPRLFAKTLLLTLALAAIFAPSASAAEGISAAKALGGSDKTTTGTSSRTKTSGAGSTTGTTKEQLSITTVKPGSGQTVSGKVDWEVAALAGSPSKVEFAIDGSTRFSDSSAPYSGTLDTTTLSNGSHTLTATAFGLHGVKATTSVTVRVANTVPTPEPEPAPTPEPSTGSPIYWGATIGTQLTGGQAPWDMSAVAKFEEETSKKVSLVQFFQPFANCNPTAPSTAFRSTRWKTSACTGRSRC